MRSYYDLHIGYIVSSTTLAKPKTAITCRFQTARFIVNL